MPTQGSQSSQVLLQLRHGPLKVLLAGALPGHGPALGAKRGLQGTLHFILIIMMIIIIIIVVIIIIITIIIIIIIISTLVCCSFLGLGGCR